MVQKIKQHFMDEMNAKATGLVPVVLEALVDCCAPRATSITTRFLSTFGRRPVHKSDLMQCRIKKTIRAQKYQKYIAAVPVWLPSCPTLGGIAERGAGETSGGINSFCSSFLTCLPSV